MATHFIHRGERMMITDGGTYGYRVYREQDGRRVYVEDTEYAHRKYAEFRAELAAEPGDWVYGEYQEHLDEWQAELDEQHDAETWMSRIEEERHILNDIRMNDPAVL